VPEQRSWNPEIMNFIDFPKFPKKTEWLEKFQLLAKRGFKLMEKTREKMGFLPLGQATL